MDERIEQFDYGIWRHDGRLVEIKTEGNMARDWSAGSPILIFHNLSHKNQGITPYSMEDTYSAVLLGETLFTRYDSVLA